MEKTGKIYGVSLGPGDPDLITLKGLKILEKVDKIYFPGSLYADGSKLSYAMSILENYSLDSTKMQGFYLEMDLERVQAKKVYETTYQLIKKDYEKGLSIAVVSEGDLNTFSSFSYILEKILADKLSVSLVPGITSYAMGASENLAPLCLQNDRLLIIPRVQTEAQLQEALDNYDTVVLMKIKSVIPVLEAVLSKKAYRINYSEKLGTAAQFTSSNWEEIITRDIPYFSLITIRK
ncbi:MAG: precorrin-2 C(20)-methyltransferase [Flavobacteriaceae bacterium]|nr:MAG: precorrin-2 C(20)-methyltransferase [Flavobacteriaceae bacterium]